MAGDHAPGRTRVRIARKRWRWIEVASPLPRRRSHDSEIDRSIANLLVSDLGAVAWTSNDELLFGKDGQLWTVSATAAKPARMSGALGDAGAFTLSPDRKQIAFLRRGQI